MTPEELAELRARFIRYWEEIRGARLSAGQPRGPDSAFSVALARKARGEAAAAGDGGLILDASWMLAYSLTANEDYKESLDHWNDAVGRADTSGDRDLAARIRIGFITALTHAGEYERALAAGHEAEGLLGDGDRYRQARLCTNIGNIYHRLDQHVQSYDYYVRAAEVFRELGAQQEEAQVCLNLGNFLSQVYRFEEADAMYERVESICEYLKLAELGTQASHSRAYIQYLRGRYGEALQAFARVRTHFKEAGSQRYLGLCDLSEAQIHLQLNLSADAATLASSASRTFSEISMAYEEGKAIAYYGAAMVQMRHFGEALEAFSAAQRIFEKEGNAYWIAALDHHRGEVHLALGRFWEALALARKASDRFETLGIPLQHIGSLVLSGRVALGLGDLDSAEKRAEEAFAIAEGRAMPLVMFPCYVFRAEIADRRGDSVLAERCYRLAAEDLEAHQSRLVSDEMRLTFAEGRHSVYEALVRIHVARSQAPESEDESSDESDGQSTSESKDVAVGAALKEAYAWCERAKSRGLVELLSHHISRVAGRGERSLLDRIHRLREEINLSYVKARPESQAVLPESEYKELLAKEQELARSLRGIALNEPEYASLQQVSTVGIDTARQILPDDSTLIEYFVTRDEVLAFVITREGVRLARKLAPPGQIRKLQERLAFQLEKFQLGEPYIRAHSVQMSRTTQHYLAALYDALVRPLADWIGTSRLIIAPHGSLHFLPFHALFDGERYLIDRFEIAYVPSASILKYCLEKPDVSDSEPLIVGVPDENAPMVEAEVREIAAGFPNAPLLCGEDATRAAFVAAIRRTSFLHVAAHAVFRQDNPMFSSFKLADGYVTAMDLFSMTCETNLVTLSGCQSGVGRVSGSDDLVGLMRAFLYAGARSLILSLWNVNDRSAAVLMTRFYKEWRGGLGKPAALRKAMQAVREEYPDPFHWAPFILTGKV